MKINYALGEPPQSEQLTEEKYTVNEDEDSEGIYIEFDIPISEKYKYWTTRVYIEGLGPVAEEVQYTDSSKKRGCFYYPFVEAGKEYTIRIVFLRDEDRDKNNKDISFGHRGDDGSIGWFETKVTAGSESKGEVRFTSKGKIDVKKNGEFKFIEKPTFQNEKLLGSDWEVDIGLVEGVSWEHTDRRTKWHSMQIPNDELGKPINLYEKQEKEGAEYSIDFICVRPILNYEYEGKTYKYQWDSFVRDIYYPPIANSDLINGIYVELDLPKQEFSRCDVTIDGIGKVAEMKDDSINFLDNDKSQASFFYPFVEPGKKYTVRFSFKKQENMDGEFTIPTPDDTIIEHPYTVTVGAKSKGEVRVKSKGKVDAASTKQGNFKFTEKPTFENEQLLTEDGHNWQIELGLMEGISWEHGPERRTKWHCTVRIPSNELDVETNLYEKGAKESDSIDCICIRPILLNYEYKGKKYSYQWDGFVHDVYYPPIANSYGIYVELDLPKQPFSRCDVTIDGIGKVAEEVLKLDGNRGCFFYPFVEPSKEYTIYFSFKDIEIPDSEGFVCYTTKNDTLSEVKMNVTADSRAKGEVHLPKEKHAILKADSDCKITYFQKPTFENEHLLGNNWMIEIGLMEGVSWNHGEERRTKWHCAVAIPKRDFDKVENKNLRDLELSPRNDNPCNHDHDIDCICVRPIMSYEHNGKKYNYMWDGDAFDVHYPLDFQEIDINNPADVAKIKGTWTQSGEWDETEHFLAKVHGVYNETLVIDDANVKTSYSYTYTKLNGSAFTKEELADMVDRSEPYLTPIPSSEIDAFENELPKDENVLKFEKYLVYYEQEEPYYQYYIYKLDDKYDILSNNGKTLTTKDDSESPLSMRFGDYDYSGDDQQYTQHYQLKLFQDGKQLQVLTYGTDEEGYYEWTDIYQKQ